MTRVKVLSVAGSPRRDCFNVRNLKLEYEFHDAIPFANVYQSTKGNSLTKTEISCAASHRDILEHFIYSDESVRIVLEDDVFPIESRLTDLSTIENFVSEHPDPVVLFLGGMKDIRSHRLYFTGKRLKFQDIDLFLSYKSDEYLQRTCCYALNKRAAKIIYQANEKIRFRADDWKAFNHKKNIRYFLVQNDIFEHPDDPFTSTIDHSRNENSTVLRGILIVSRFLKKISNLIRLKFQ